MLGIEGAAFEATVVCPEEASLLIGQSRWVGVRTRGRVSRAASTGGVERFLDRPHMFFDEGANELSVGAPFTVNVADLLYPWQ